MLGIRRSLQHEVKRTQPIMQQMLLQVVEFVDINDQKQLATWVAVFFGFHLFLRKSSLIPVNQDHDCLHQLSHADIRDADDVLVAEIKWTKTNQFSQKNRVPVDRDRNSPTDPVSWLLFMVRRIPANGEHNLFSFHYALGELVPVMYNGLTVQLKHWLADIGINNLRNFSSHSLRRQNNACI